MAYISYDKLWRSEFYNSVSANDRVQDKNLNQSKLKVNHTNKKDEKRTTSFESSDIEVVVNEAHMDVEKSTVEGYISYTEKGFIEFILRNDKQSEKEVSIERAVKKTIPILYHLGIFDQYKKCR